MILQALHQYYERLTNSSNSEVPPYGFSREKIHFAIEIDDGGNFIRDLDIRGGTENKKSPKEMIVPAGGGKKSVNIRPNFLWGNTSYVLGFDSKGNPKRTKHCFEEFKKYQHEVGDGLDDEGMKAVLEFLDKWNPESVRKLKYLDEMIGMNVVFKLDKELNFIHERSAIKERWVKQYSQETAQSKGVCLVTGKEEVIVRIHSPIKGVKNAQPSGAAIVSFNKDAFTSYHKTQGYNASIGKRAEFSYTTALNYLLRFDSSQKIHIGDTTTVFWAAKESPVEGFLGKIFDPRDDHGESPEIRLFLEAVREGRKPNNIDSDNQFFILGLAPNESRLAVRFWHVSTVGDIASKIGQHFQDLRIAKESDNQLDYPGMWHLLMETLPKRKGSKREMEDVPPLLSSALMRSILTGLVYPRMLLSSVIERIRLDGDLNYYRAAIIKACLVRKYRIMNQPLEVKMTLNKDSTNVAYRLGRLFAVLEEAQKTAILDVKANIKDRYYSSASATPKVVFPVLLRLAQHHLQKSDFRILLEKYIQEIVSPIQEFPAHLSLDEQGLFALGYYHQKKEKKDIYTKSERKEETSHV